MRVASEEVGERLRTLIGAAATSSYLPLDALVDSFPDAVPAVQLAYAQSMFFVRFLDKRGGPAALRVLLTELRAGLPFDLAFAGAYGEPVEALWGSFVRTLDPAMAWIVLLTGTAALWGGILALVVVAWVRRRRLAARKRRAWDLEDALQALPPPGTPPDAADVQ
jgi:Flp pilus assembly protein TadB